LADDDFGGAVGMEEGLMLRTGLDSIHAAAALAFTT